MFNFQLYATCMNFKAAFMEEFSTVYRYLKIIGESCVNQLRVVIFLNASNMHFEFSRIFIVVSKWPPLSERQKRRCSSRKYFSPGCVFNLSISSIMNICLGGSSWQQFDIFFLSLKHRVNHLSTRAAANDVAERAFSECSCRCLIGTPLD